MKEIFKKLVIATITLFAAFLITYLVIGNNFFKNNGTEILVCYVAYILIYLCILLLKKKIFKKEIK